MNALRYFELDEFKCRGQNCCGGSNHIAPVFVRALDELRHRYGRPLVVSSGYRCPIHNARVSSTGADGPHTTGRAGDLGVDRAEALQVLRIALEMACFMGIGIHQKGAGRFIHLDTLPDRPGQPRPTIWSY
jgi:zinc D-Ala-D-Ala carboxypeptidase